MKKLPQVGEKVVVKSKYRNESDLAKVGLTGNRVGLELSRNMGYVTSLDEEDTLDVKVDFSFGVFWFPREYLKRV